MTTIVAPPGNASKWQMGFNSVFKGLNKNGHRKTVQGTEKVKPPVTVMSCVISLLILVACCHF
jgi:hypothetical protein